MVIPANWQFGQSFVVLQTLLLYVLNPCMAVDYTLGDNKGWEFGLDQKSWAFIVCIKPSPLLIICLLS